MNINFRRVSSLLENIPVLRCSVRFRGKINIQKPKTPHYERAKMLKLVEPYYPKRTQNMSMVELCGNLNPKRSKVVVENPYTNILAKECLNWFKHCKLIALFHLNPMSAEERFRAHIQYRKQNMHMKVYGLETLRTALRGTEFEVFTHHYVSHNMLVFSAEPSVKQLLKTSKRFPQMVLLSAVLEGRFVSRDELVAYGQVAGLPAAQAQLAAVLDAAAGGQLLQRLGQPQTDLAAMLAARGAQAQ